MPYEPPGIPRHPDEGIHTHESADLSGHELDDDATDDVADVEPDTSTPPR